MKSQHFLTILKGVFFSFILLLFTVGCSKDDGEPPTAEFSFTPTNPMVNEEVSFTNKSLHATSYQWSAEGTSFSSTDENPKFTFDTA
ncbi:hypothetical protein ACFQZW_07150, partial [Lutibacter aestuarii]